MLGSESSSDWKVNCSVMVLVSGMNAHSSCSPVRQEESISNAARKVTRFMDAKIIIFTLNPGTLFFGDRELFNDLDVLSVRLRKP